MDLVHEEHVIIAETAEDFAGAVQMLYEDPELWERLQQAGRAHAARHFGLDRMRKATSEMLSNVPTATRAGNRSVLSPAP